VVLDRVDGTARNVRIAVMGVGEIASRIAPAEAALEGRTPDAAVIAEAVAALRAAVEPMSDLSASADYRRHLAGTLAAKVIAQAWERAA